MNGNRSTLLIVDDEPSVRIAFAEALGDDYNLMEADAGVETLEILQSREDIDLVLLDYLLPPGIDGLKVLKKMKALECKVPVIMVTGKGSEEVAVKAFKLGARNYITKPFRVKELQVTIRDILDPVVGGKSLVEKAVEFMEEQYCQPISAGDVARVIGVSYVHLAHIFKMEKGFSIIYWLNKLRIERAKVLLRDPNLEVKEVAAKVGFNDPNYFCRVFKKFTMMSPLEYSREFE